MQCVQSVLQASKEHNIIVCYTEVYYYTTAVHSPSQFLVRSVLSMTTLIRK